MEHVKGQWEWSTGDPNYKNYGVYSIAEGRIAEVLNQNRTNARLIAAAPDLLEACQNTFTWIADHFGDFDSEVNKQLLCLSNEIEAAIAKVEGKALAI